MGDSLKKIVSTYSVAKTVRCAADDYIGIPFEVTVLFDADNFSVQPGATGTPIVIYVINSGAVRVGTRSDEEIVGGMLARGYAVVLLDYLGNEKAVSPALDWSAQKVRNRIADGEFFAEARGFTAGSYMQTVIVPSGHDLSFGNVFFEIDKHGADGTLEKIVEIWNNDFRGTNAERVIKWTDGNGRFKAMQTAHDGSLPFRCSADGTPDENGEYTFVKYTKAESIEDCVKPDGTRIDLKLYMHIIYPTSPKNKVPVLCLAGSSEHLCRGAATVDRPQLVGATFNGYAGVMFDFGYTPMARVDHYGYFDGYPKKGYITGDNPTYSIQTYNDKRINCAAMRYLRYLAYSSEEFAFDTDAFGIYGNSKGGWMGFLGEKEPEKMVSRRIFAGHHDETRYENGDTLTRGTVNGGEPQPWLTYGDKPIAGGANLIYCSCGGTDDNITAGHAPTFISCNRRDSSCYGTSNAFVNLCRYYNVPAMWVDINAPHTLVQGPELNYGYDTYAAFFDFIGYFLKGDAVKVVGARMDHSRYPAVFNLRFSGSVDGSEAEKIKVLDAEGKPVGGSWSQAFGGVEWTFVPDALCGNSEYELYVPENVCGSNGKQIQAEYRMRFKTLASTVTSVEVIAAENCKTLRFTAPNGKNEAVYIAVSVVNDGVNTIGVYDASGARVGYVGVSGRGVYRIDITEYLASVVDGEPIELTLKAEKKAEVKTVFKTDRDDNFSGITAAKRAKSYIGSAPDGTSAIAFDGFESDLQFPTEEMYHSPDAAFNCNAIIKPEPISAEDMGRRFKIKLSLYDTVSRYVRVTLNHCTSMKNSITDLRRTYQNIVTRPGEWMDVELDYTVYEPMYGELGVLTKQLSVGIVNSGAVTNPIYFSGVETVETVTEPEIGAISLLSYSEKYKGLPEGMVDIVCQKSPWSK
ncbi:MAG: hypothetical protein IJY04_08215 [Clostridia bacterium]|nr:hypothetical protein [Clostridia bacterium]